MNIIKSVKTKKAKLARKKQIDTVKKVGAGALIGTTLGAGVGILLAPKSGEETRADISDKTKNIIDETKLNVQEAVNKVKTTADIAKETVEEVKDTVDAKKAKVKKEIK